MYLFIQILFIMTKGMYFVTMIHSSDDVDLKLFAPILGYHHRRSTWTYAYPCYGLNFSFSGLKVL